MRFILEVNDNKKGRALIKFLQNLPFVKLKSADGKRKKNAEKALDRIFGLWKHRDISKNKLREKAWRL